MDLAKVGEVKHLFLSLFHEDAADNLVNEWLAKGYVILTIKVSEHRSSEWKESDRKWHPTSSAMLVYVLGKPRNRPGVVTKDVAEFAARVSANAGKPFPVGAEIEEADAWLRKNLPNDDRDHPDFMLHAKGSS